MNASPAFATIWKIGKRCQGDIKGLVYLARTTGRQKGDSRMPSSRIRTWNNRHVPAVLWIPEIKNVDEEE